MPLYVVSSVSSPNGIGGTQTVNYRYGGLKADVTGRGLLGFRWKREHHAQTGVMLYTYYRQDFPYTGLPSVVKKTLSGAGSSGVLSQTTNTYACMDPASGTACTVGPGKRYFPYVSKSVEKSWDLNGAALPIVTTVNTYDTWGNPTKIVVATNDGHSKTTTNVYDAPDLTKWYLGRLTRASVTSVAP